MLRIALIIVFFIGLSENTYGQSPLQLLQLETVNYGALPSGGEFDRPSIAVRNDGLVRIAITDSQGGCCPVVAPLKVATRGAVGDWTYLTITNYQIPSDLVVKSQVTDIIDLLLQLVRHPNGVHRSCHHRKSRGAVLSTSAVQWATTKFDGVWSISLQTGTGESCQALTTVAWWYL